MKNEQISPRSRYPDSRILTKEGTQLTYGKCAAGVDYPLFYGTSSNSYGKQLDACVSSLHIKTIILPRQARDKHRES